MEPSALLAAFHGRLLRQLSARAGTHFQGLAQAARHLSKGLDTRQRRFLLNLGTAHNASRHVTTPLLENFEKELAKATGGLTTPSSSAPPGCAPPTAGGHVPRGHRDWGTLQQLAGQGSAVLGYVGSARACPPERWGHGPRGRRHGDLLPYSAGGDTTTLLLAPAGFFFPFGFARGCSSQR